MSLGTAWTKWTGLLMILLLSLQGCSGIEPFFCKARIAYTVEGKVDKKGYTVDRDCLRGQEKRVRACYKE